MSLSGLPLQSIATGHIDALRENVVRESRDLDYKRDYSLATQSEKAEFAKDVIAFANSIGGDIVFGIKDVDGTASEIPGISPIEVDKEQLRIEQMLAAVVTPRISGISFKNVILPNGNVVFIVRVPLSVSAPHIIRDDGRFYGRNSTGRYVMDIYQVREAFVQADMVSNRLKAFREGRIHWIEHNEVGARLPSPRLIVVHLMPLQALREPARFDGRFMRQIGMNKLTPMKTHQGIGDTLNFDGYRVHSSLDATRVVGYTQLFRGGCLEAVDSVMMLNEDSKFIPVDYEKTVRDSIHRFIGTLRELAMQGPVAIGLSLLGVKGRTILKGDRVGGKPSIEHNNLVLPEVLVDADVTAEDIDKALRYPFDLVWNACGGIGSPNFADDGKWKAK